MKNCIKNLSKLKKNTKHQYELGLDYFINTRKKKRQKFKEL